MTLFWIISAAMILAALAVLARTLLRKHQTGTDTTERFNVEIAREHLAELVKQKDAGELSDEEFAQAKHDLELALAEDLENTQHQPAVAPQSDGGMTALVVAAVLIPVVAVSLYFKIGSPQLIDKDPTAQTAAGHGGSANLPPIDELVAELRERMVAEPDNPQGWFLLGRTYMRLQNYPDAVMAFEHVVELLPEDPNGLVALADALTMQNGRKFTARATKLLEKSLTFNPQSIDALWLLGKAAADQGDNTKAIEYWQLAYPMLAGEPGMQSELGQLITQAGGEVPASPAALPPIMSQAQAPAKQAAAQPDAATGAQVNVEVALAPAVMENAQPTDTVFILARAESGPPMPLAVARHQVSELPIQVTLSDAMAMMPAMKLSSFARVKISARVSKSGQAGIQPGDLAAADVAVDSANPPDVVQLLIDHVVE